MFFASFSSIIPSAHLLEASLVGGGLLLGWLITRLWSTARLATVNERLKAEERRCADAEARLARASAESAEHEKDAQSYRVQLSEASTRLAAQTQSAAEKQALLDHAERRLADTFKALSADALKASSEQFLQLAKTTLAVHTEEARGDIDQRRAAIDGLIKPMSDALGLFQQRLGEVEQQRTDSYAELRTQIRSLGEGQSGLRRETSALVTALRQPSGRGKWGELQLQRVVELAGMTEHCDFETQHTTAGEGRDLRPDMIVRLPGGRIIVIDSKAPMDAYLDAIEAADEGARREALARHARQVRVHIQQLAAKGYSARFATSPEFTVLFLPGESFFSAALQSDPSLIERGADQGVILATPTTLIAMLRAVAHAWRQESLAENAREISALGELLHQRLGGLAQHFMALGRSLGASVDHYNQAVGSFETRVLATARRFTELRATASSAKLPEVPFVDRRPRSLRQSAEQPAVAGGALVSVEPVAARAAAADLRAALEISYPTHEQADAF